MPSARYESSLDNPAPLGKPLSFEFSGRIAKNRFLKAASTEHLASWDTEDVESRGIPTKNLINVYRVSIKYSFVIMYSLIFLNRDGVRAVLARLLLATS